MPISGGSALTPFAILEYFYNYFRDCMDDLLGIVIGGTATNPANLIANNLLVDTDFTLNEYVELQFPLPVNIREMRLYGNVASNANNRYRLQALVDDVWVDALVGIVDTVTAAWGAWLPLTTPRTAIFWRLENTVFDTAAALGELELRGIGFGG